MAEAFVRAGKGHAERLELNLLIDPCRKVASSPVLLKCLVTFCPPKRLRDVVVLNYLIAAMVLLGAGHLKEGHACRAQKSIWLFRPMISGVKLSPDDLSVEGLVFQWVGWAIKDFIMSRASLVAENLCLRQQLLVLQRRHPRPRLRDADRRFWILACRWFSGWRRSLLIVKPETVLGWHRKGWKSYWRWRSRAPGNNGRHPIRDELRLLIRRMTSENALWGQRRIQAELARLGYKVSARTVAKYMRRPHGREPAPGWRIFLKQHAGET